MSDENVAVVEGMFAAWNDGDLPKAQEAIHDEIEFEAAIGSDLDGTHYGRNGFLRAMQGFWREFENRQSHPEECIAAGDVVFAAIHHRATGRMSGAEVEMRDWQVYTLRDGKIVKYGLYATREQALAAAGILQ
jgi:ketosteroid isomerase-like protein